jgi:type II secretory pathway pseudopilin PulG
MRNANTHGPKHCRYFMQCVAVAFVMFALSLVSVSQTTTARQPQMDFSRELSKYPGLLPEFGKLIEKLQHNVQFPPARNQSSLLRLLPASTTYYAAFPNYGDAVHQALMIFRQELQESSVLRDWWQHAASGTSGSQLEGSVEKFYELSQYLGDEIVVSGESGSADHSFLLVAEVRKPGFKNFLEQILKGLPGTSQPAMRVMDPKELALANDRSTSHEWAVLVRPDFVVAAPNVKAVRDFNELLEKRGRNFAATPFGQRVGQAYQGGAEVLVAADFHNILSHVPLGTQQNEAMFDRTGFNDAKYFVWEHKNVAGHAASEMELSFAGPRHGVAAWLAAPARLGSLDFVSPKAVLSATLVLKNLAGIFDDIKEISSQSNPNAFAIVDQMQRGMNINLKGDLLSHLDGEITVELDEFVQPVPAWRAILRVNDPDGLQQTLNKLLSAAGQTAKPQSGEDGVNYHAVLVPSPQTPVQIVYAFVDGYLIIGSSHESLAEAVRLHRSGESLAKSAKFLAALPQGHSAEASALFYEDPIAMTAARLRQMSPEMADAMAHLETAPLVVSTYGEDTAIRAASSGGAADASAILVMAAIAIPNLLRAKMSANESSAVGTMRTINTAQITYSVTYPQRGFARDLATLGPDPRGPGRGSPEHADLIDTTLGGVGCAADGWCTKSGYRFSVTTQCSRQRVCKEFVAVGTPVTNNAGARNFCSTSDGVIRYKAGPPMTAVVTASQCREWPPLQ